ncbi:TetR family transcriptional regulator [Subtercola sp. YIM 133946]|uniref:TetR family transcriptional regulator n=1 Tax=Subtercola sp. YIM 133946 TaxID=3118909 RepID=UPI002F94D3B8
MGRWLPDAHGRLASAALELYSERGFEQTTALEIAERAGVTERTFFRYFADKREVLFQGSQELQRIILETIADAPDDMRPIDMVVASLEKVGAQVFDRTHSIRRAAIIAANPALQERELLKFSTLSAAIAEALRERGVPDPSATLAAETGVTIFKIGFESWIAGTPSDDWVECIRETVAQLRLVTPSAISG